MIQKITDFKPGDKFKIGGRFGNIYGGKTFTVTRLSGEFLWATAVDHKQKDTGVKHCFAQANFDYYGECVQRIKGDEK